ncbi:hypothetical protein BSIN_2171 [Burkholderia singularis]|uniref:Uncharacterized protein n=1 Tax=Burkholderia singularis TaxID=1503053 RepID=A0A238H150_9BURK|nr:hypothetical protein BSIN_2171 [Burkholderia singularis]
MYILPAFSTACADVAATHGTSETVTLNFRHIITATGKPLTATAVSEAPGTASRASIRARSPWPVRTPPRAPSSHR